MLFPNLFLIRILHCEWKNQIVRLIYIFRWRSWPWRCDRPSPGRPQRLPLEHWRTPSQSSRALRHVGSPANEFPFQTLASYWLLSPSLVSLVFLPTSPHALVERQLHSMYTFIWFIRIVCLAYFFLVEPNLCTYPYMCRPCKYLAYEYLAFVTLRAVHICRQVMIYFFICFYSSHLSYTTYRYILVRVLINNPAAIFNPFVRVYYSIWKLMKYT